MLTIDTIIHTEIHYKMVSKHTPTSVSPPAIRPPIIYIYTSSPSVLGVKGCVKEFHIGWEFCGIVLSLNTIFKTVSAQVLILWPVFVLHHRCQRRLLPLTTPPFIFFNFDHIQSSVVVNSSDNQPAKPPQIRGGFSRRQHHLSVFSILSTPATF